MRPVYIRSKMKCKNNKNKLSKTTFKFCGPPGILTSDFDNINKILHNKKLQLAKGRGAWKIMPKDSCEVYKERRQRQLERNRQSSEKDSNKNYYNAEKKITKRPSRRERQNYKYGQRSHGSPFLIKHITIPGSNGKNDPRVPVAVLRRLVRARQRQKHIDQ